MVYHDYSSDPFLFHSFLSSPVQYTLLTQMTHCCKHRSIGSNDPRPLLVICNYAYLKDSGVEFSILGRPDRCRGTLVNISADNQGSAWLYLEFISAAGVAALMNSWLCSATSGTKILDMVIQVEINLA